MKLLAEHFDPGFPQSATAQPKPLPFKSFADAVKSIAAAGTQEGVLTLSAQYTRELIGAHQVIGTLISSRKESLRSVVSLSPEYANNPAKVHHPDLAKVVTLAARAFGPVRIDAALDSTAWLQQDQTVTQCLPQTWMVVALVSQTARPLGMIQLLDKIEGDFSAEDEAVLTLLAQAASMAIALLETSSKEHVQRRLAEEEASERRQAVSNTHSLVRIIKKLTCSLELDSVLDNLIAESMQLVGADSGCAGVRSLATMTCKRRRSGPNTFAVTQTWPSGCGLPGRVLASRALLLGGAVGSGQAVCENCGEVTGNAICAPVFDREGEPMGFFQLHKKEPFSYSDQRLVVWTAQAVSLALQNSLAHERVQQAEHTLRELSGRLIHLQDEERRRIARELHDTTGQTLAGLVMNLGSLREWATGLDTKTGEILIESIALAKQCVADIRTLSYLLHPPTLDEFGLSSAITWYVKGFSQRSGIHVTVDVPPLTRRLPQEIELTLFRIVQQGLANIHQHSGSATAKIEMHIDEVNACLTVTDYGEGLKQDVFSDENTDGIPLLGVGIPGMRERLKQLGGELRVDSHAGLGTTVTAMLPLGNLR